MSTCHPTLRKYKVSPLFHESNWSLSEPGSRYGVQHQDSALKCGASKSRFSDPFQDSFTLTESECESEHCAICYVKEPFSMDITVNVSLYPVFVIGYVPENN